MAPVRAWLLSLVLGIGGLSAAHASPGADAPPASPRPADDPIFAQLKARFGPPRVMVEPMRPSHLSDREAATELSSALHERGFLCVNPQMDRSARLDIADRAVVGGMDPGQVTQALEARPDFSLRVTVEEHSDEESVYDIPMIRSSVLIRIDASRIGDSRPVAIPPLESIRRSRDGAKARSEAIKLATASAATVVESTLREVWCAMGDGSANRIIEVEGAFDPTEDDHVRVLESVPGVRTVLQLTAHEKRPNSAFGTVVFERPGYALVFVQPSGAGGRWVVGALAGALLTGAVIFMRRTRKGP